MEIRTYHQHQIMVAELIEEGIVIKSAASCTQMLTVLHFQGVQEIILREENVTDDFYDLQNGIAAEILEEFVEYRMSLTIVGEFNKYKGQTISDFIDYNGQQKQLSFHTALD